MRSGVGAAHEVSTEGGVGAGRLEIFLLPGISGVAVVWGGYVGAIGANGVEVRGSACGFPETGNKAKGKAAEGRAVAEGGGKRHG